MYTKYKKIQGEKTKGSTMTIEVLHMKIKKSRYQPSSKLGVQVFLDTKTARMWTDDLRYGPGLEVVYSKEKTCFTVKNLNKIRERWLKKHGRNVKDVDNVIKKYLKS